MYRTTNWNGEANLNSVWIVPEKKVVFFIMTGYMGLAHHKFFKFQAFLELEYSPTDNHLKIK